jgi:hypothetical protein
LTTADAMGRVNSMKQPNKVLGEKMNQFVNYLWSQLNKRTCPIDSIEYDWKSYITITFKDGTTLKLVKKPKPRKKSIKR